MARTPAQRGTFGWWLTQAREARYETQRDALAAMAKLAGLQISPSEYSQWESGSRVPRDDNPKREALYAFFGSKPEENPEVAGSDALAAAINALVEELRASRQVREDVEARLRALEAEVGSLRGRPGAAGSPERPVLRT